MHSSSRYPGAAVVRPRRPDYPPAAIFSFLFLCGFTAVMTGAWEMLAGAIN